jgi:hypothetical protein
LGQGSKVQQKLAYPLRHFVLLIGRAPICDYKIILPMRMDGSVTYICVAWDSSTFKVKKTLCLTKCLQHTRRHQPTSKVSFRSARQCHMSASILQVRLAGPSDFDFSRPHRYPFDHQSQATLGPDVLGGVIGD